MATRKYTNNGRTVLNGAINNSTTSVTVSDGSVFPSSGNFTVRVDDEFMLVTARASDVLTVTRAQEGSTAVSHSDAVSIYSPFSAGMLDGIRGDACQAGAGSALPSNEKAGILYFPTGKYDRFIARDNGSTWDRLYAPKMNFQPLSGLAWVSQGTATADDDGGMLTMQCGAEVFNGTTILVHLLKKALTLVGGSCTFTCQLFPTVAAQQYSRAGIMMRESGTGKIYWLLVQGANNAPNDIVAEYWASTSAFTSAASGSGRTNIFHISTYSNGLWFRIKYDGTNMKAFVSGDGKFWMEIHSVAKTTPFTSAPDEIGLALLPHNATYPIAVSVGQWIEE